METYKRSPFELAKGIVIAFFTGGAAYMIVGMFTRNVIFGFGIPALITLAILYISVFSEDICFELDPDGVFRYYNRRILQNTFNLTNCYIAYHRKSETGLPSSHDISLKILDTTTEDGETSFDCSPLGLQRFNEMFTAMEHFAIKHNETLSAGAS
jgi:hypothetical protein